MKQTLGSTLCLLALTAGALHAAQPPVAALPESQRAFLNAYCTDCHNEQKQKGHLRLDNITFNIAQDVKTADAWQKVLNALNSGDMPPEEAKKQPEAGAKTEFLDQLAGTLVVARRSFGDQGGRNVMRRLNRREYRNTLRELLGVEIDVRDLPADGGAGAFDTVGSSLFMSSDQFEQYLVLGRAALDDAFARLPTTAAADAKGKPFTRRIEHRETEIDANKQVRGLLNGYYLGGYRAAKQWEAAGGKRPPSDFGLPDEAEAKFRITTYERHGPTIAQYLARPHADDGSFLTIREPHEFETITLPDDAPAGSYKLRLRLAATNDSKPEERFIEMGTLEPKSRDFGLIKTFQVTGSFQKPQVLEIPVQLTITGPRAFTFRQKQPNDRAATFEIYEEHRKRTGVGPDPVIWIDWVEWEGPLTTDAPIAGGKTVRIEPESKTAELTRSLAFSAQNHEKFQQWKAAGAKKEDLGQFGFQTDYQAEFREAVWQQNHTWLERYIQRPKAKTGFYLDNTVHETTELTVDLPADAAAGDYVMRVKIGRVMGMPDDRAFLSFVEASPVDKDARTFLDARQVHADEDHAEVIELPFRVTPKGPRKFILMERRPLAKQEITVAGMTRLMKDAKRRDPVLWIDWVEYQGPLTSKSSSGLEELLRQSAGGLETERARMILESFAERAFRGVKPEAAYIQKLVKLFETRRQAGDAFEVAIRQPMSVVLASPGFLYLAEPGAETSRSLSDLELATRLSYFLWSAPPDQTLLALARSGELHKPEVLAAQVDRMLDDRRSFDFVTGFTFQWLGLDRLDFFQFNAKLFRDFDESAKAAAKQEVYQTIDHLLRSNGSLGRLLKSDEVVVNGLLGTYYGLPNVSGDEFRVVKTPAGSPRGGLLGMAAILAMGGNGERTSPVERGAWVLRKLLHDPPPPAPPNVPQLTRLEGKLLTTRERLLAHQEQPQCASCHRKIDPIGFGLENFDAAGRWRTEDSYEKKGVGKKAWTIDPAGALHKGPAFKNYFELRDIIAGQTDRFARGFTEALIEYALGRPYSLTDDALAESVVKQAQQKQFAMRQFIHALVASREFHTK